MNLLITGTWKYTREQLEAIQALGYHVIDMPNEQGEMPLAYDKIDAVICNGLFLYHPIERFSSLKYIQLTSAGLDRVPVEYVLSHGIELHNAAGVYSIPMAEFAVASALYFYKQFSFFDTNQKKSCWEKHRGLREIFGKTVCIVGCGDVGIECAKRFSAFGCRVIGVNRSPKSHELINTVFPMEGLQEALKSADIIVISVALTEQTKHLIDDKALSAIKKGSLLINVARGAVIDSNALIAYLHRGDLYAALDVFEEEPLPENSPLWHLDHAFVTPHNSFVSDGNQERLWNVIFKNLEMR